MRGTVLLMCSCGIVKVKLKHKPRVVFWLLKREQLLNYGVVLLMETGFGLPFFFNFFYYVLFFTLLKGWSGLFVSMVLTFYFQIC